MQVHHFDVPVGGDVTHGWALLAVCWAFNLVAFITTVMRVMVRSRLTRNLGSDDYVMVAAMVTTLMGAGLITAQVLNGLGRHEYYLQPSQRRLFQAIGWADWIQSFITLALTKISICLFLMRIVDSKKIRIFLWSLITFLTLFTTVCIAFFLGVCRPLRAYWEVGVPGVCLSDEQIKVIVIVQGVLSIVTDLICAAFPTIFLRKLQIRFRTKVALSILMGLGLITAACCTVRTVLSGAVTDPDITWAITANVAWRLPEVNIGIVCANAPVLRPLYLFYRGRLATQKVPSVSYGNGGSWPKDGKWPDSRELGKVESPSKSISPHRESSSYLTGTDMSAEMGLSVPQNGQRVQRDMV